MITIVDNAKTRKKRKKRDLVSANVTKASHDVPRESLSFIAVGITAI